MEEEPQKSPYNIVLGDLYPFYGFCKYYLRYFKNDPKEIDTKARLNLVAITVYQFVSIDLIGKILTGESVLEKSLF